MNEYQDSPDVYRDHDAESDEEPNADCDTSDQSPYTVHELAAIFTDFYKFLTTLHFDPADLKFPPSIGWGTTIFPAAIVGSKSAEVLELMRHLPYFRENERSTHVHYKSKLIDYTDSQQHDPAQTDDEILKDARHGSSDDDRTSGHSHLLVIAGGYDSGGRTFILDVLNGEITEEVIRYNTCAPVDVKDFFENLKEEFRTLKLIPCPGRETQEAERVPELARAITEEEIRAQTEQWYPGTDLDWQFVRQVYRQYGWPDHFRRREAVDFIEEFMERDKDVRDEWERAFQ